VANSIFEIKMNNQLPNSDFAILYRTNAQSRSMEEALRKMNIPYRIYGGLSFYKRKEIKDLLAYFRVVINPVDEEALKRIINYPARGIGQTTIDRIVVASDDLKVTMWEVLANIDNYDLGINQGIKSRIANFVTMMKRFMVQNKTRNAYELAGEIAKASGIMKDLDEDKTPEGISRIENLEELLNGIKDFSENETEIMLADGDTSVRTLDKYLQDISLLTDADQDDKDDNNKVSLMTIHAAKGLEFPYVYVVGMEENLFPSIMSLNSRQDLEEERRLFYVAITRAEKAAILSYAENRYRWGNLTVCEPSRFLEEIDSEFIEFPRKVGFHPSDHHKFKSGIDPEKKTINKPYTKEHFQNSPHKPLSDDENKIPFEESDSDKIMTGMQVEHQRFGQGKVISIEGYGPSRKATVFFPVVGQKQLLLKFARLRIIE